MTDAEWIALADDCRILLGPARWRMPELPALTAAAGELFALVDQMC